MKKLLMVGLLVGLLGGVGGGLGGCTEPIPAMQDPVMPLQVSMESYWLQSQLLVTVLPVTRVGAGQLHVNIQLYNKTDFDLSVDYKYYFVDEHGAQVEIPSGSQFIRIPKRSTQQFEFTSMSASAADFRVVLRQAQ